MHEKTKRPVNIWRLTLILLAVVVLSTYLVSWLMAKFTSHSDSSDAARVANFTCAATVDGVSALSFTNTAFWGGTAEDDRIAMNALRSLYFSVRNYQEEGGSIKVCEVPMHYDLIFATPQNFAEKLAVQVFLESETAMTPQIVLSDLLKTPNGGTFSTAASEDYNGTATTDLTFTVTVADGIYTATAGEYEIRVEPVQMELTQTASFRLWDVSDLTSESVPSISNEAGELLSPLQVQFKQVTPCYRISVFSPEFLLPAGVQTTVKHTLTLTPTAALNDNHLGGFCVDDSNQFIKSLQGGDTVKISTIKEQFTDTMSDGTVVTSSPVTLIGGKKNYKVGNVETEIVSESFDNVAKNYTFPGEVTSSESKTTSDWYYYDEDMNALDSQPGFFNRGYRISRTDTQTTTYTTTYTASATTISQQSKTTTTTAVNGDTVHQDIEYFTETQYAISGGTKTTVKTVTYSSTYTCQQKSTWSNTWSNSTAISNPEQYLPVPTGSTSSENTPMTSAEISALAEQDWVVVDKEFTRVITRTYETTQITALSVSRMDGSTEVSYPSGSPFQLYSGNVQKYFLSQCYAKNYPMTVNVRFEQAP